MRPAIDESPARPERSNKAAPTGVTLSSFQKNEALVWTDHSDNYAEWPAEKLTSNYIHKPIISKFEKDRKDTTGNARRETNSDPSPDPSTMGKSLSTLKSKSKIQGQSSALHPSNDVGGADRNSKAAGTGSTTGGRQQQHRGSYSRSSVGTKKGTKSRPEPIDENSVSESTLVSIEDDDNKYANLPASQQESLEMYSGSNLMGLGGHELLLKAEQLLMDVTSCIKPNNAPSAAARPIEVTQRVEGLLKQQRLTAPNTDYTGGTPDLGTGSVGGKAADPESDMAQIDWLIRGLPEAYESEPQFDDEAVEAILKEGGTAPNQLALPSVYAANQRVLEKLSAASSLRIQFKNLLVFSTRFGVRKDGTYLLIHPPRGCIRPASEPDSIMVPLPEIEDVDHHIATLLRKNDKRDSIRNYFVGGANLNKSVDLKLTINDEVMREWVNGSSGGSMRIELYGQLAPRTTSHAGVIGGKVQVTAPVRLAYSIVPLGGILGTASLAAELHCDLEVDMASHSSVASRMHNLSLGQRGAKQKPLGSKLGTITTQISLLPDSSTREKSPEDESAVAKAAKREALLEEKVIPLSIPIVQPQDQVRLTEYSPAVPSQSTLSSSSSSSSAAAAAATAATSTAESKTGDPIHAALLYTPSEAATAPHEPTTITAVGPIRGRADTPVPVVGDRATYGPNPHVTGYFGLAMCGLPALNISLDKVIKVREAGVQRCRVSVTFKLSTSLREGAMCEIDHAQRQLAPEMTHLHLCTGRLYNTNLQSWVPPVMEVWLEWGDGGHNSDTRNDSPAAKAAAVGKTLLGLANFPKSYKLNQVIELPIKDVSQVNIRGSLVISLHLGKDIEQVENTVQCSINSYMMRNPSAMSTARAKPSTIPSSFPPGVPDFPDGTSATGVTVKPAQISRKENEDNGNNGGNAQDTVGEAEMKLGAADNVASNALKLPTAEDPEGDSQDDEKQEVEEEGDRNTAGMGDTQELSLSRDSIGDLVSLLNSKPQQETSSLVEEHGAVAGEEKDEVPRMDGKGEEVTVHSVVERDGEEEIPLPPLVMTQEPMSTLPPPPPPPPPTLAVNAALAGLAVAHASDSTAPAGPGVHLLDVSVDGPFQIFQLSPDQLLAPHQVFGCYVGYQLPKALSRDVTEQMQHQLPEQGAAGPAGPAAALNAVDNFSFWWDAECPVLNGTNRHKFFCASFDELSLRSLYGLSSEDDGITFTIYWCDMDGNLPKHPTKLGDVILPLQDLCQIMSHSGNRTVLKLPVQISEPAPPSGLTVDESQCFVSLAISHRIEPVLLRQSFGDSSNSSSNNDSNSTSQHPASALDAVDGGVLRRSSRIDPVSKMLGFDLTMKDLDAMLYARTSASINPPSWTAFINSTAPTVAAAEGSTTVDDKETRSFSPSSSSYAQADTLPDTGSAEAMRIPIEVHLEEYAHLSEEVFSRLQMDGSQVKLVCTANCKANESQLTSDVYDEKHSDLIVPWYEPFQLVLHGPAPISSSSCLHERDDASEDDADGTVDGAEEEDVQQFGGNANTLLHVDRMRDPTSLFRGASVVVGIYLRQHLFASALQPAAAAAVADTTDAMRVAHQQFTVRPSTEYEDEESKSIKLTDQYVGSVVVNLTTLAWGMPVIQGWYHLMDDLHHTIGQVKLSIRPVVGSSPTADPPSTRRNQQQQRKHSLQKGVQPAAALDLVNQSLSIPITSAAAAAADEVENEVEEEDIESEDTLDGENAVAVSVDGAGVDESLLDLRGLAQDALKNSLAELDAIQQLLGARSSIVSSSGSSANASAENAIPPSAAPLDRMRSCVEREVYEEEEEEEEGGNEDASLREEENEIIKESLGKSNSDLGLRPDASVFPDLKYEIAATAAEMPTTTARDAAAAEVSLEMQWSAQRTQQQLEEEQEEAQKEEEEEEEEGNISLSAISQPSTATREVKLKPEEEVQEEEDWDKEEEADYDAFAVAAAPDTSYSRDKVVTGFAVNGFDDEDDNVYLPDFESISSSSKEEEGDDCVAEENTCNLLSVEAGGEEDGQEEDEEEGHDGEEMGAISAVVVRMDVDLYLRGDPETTTTTARTQTHAPSSPSSSSSSAVVTTTVTAAGAEEANEAEEGEEGENATNLMQALHVTPSATEASADPSRDRVCTNEDDASEVDAGLSSTVEVSLAAVHDEQEQVEEYDADQPSVLSQDSLLPIDVTSSSSSSSTANIPITTSTSNTTTSTSNTTTSTTNGLTAAVEGVPVSTELSATISAVIDSSANKDEERASVGGIETKKGDNREMEEEEEEEEEEKEEEEDTQEDSPNTTKIKNIVDEEINRIFGSAMLPFTSLPQQQPPATLPPPVAAVAAAAAGGGVQDSVSGSMYPPYTPYTAPPLPPPLSSMQPSAAAAPPPLPPAGDAVTTTSTTTSTTNNPRSVQDSVARWWAQMEAQTEREAVLQQQQQQARVIAQQSLPLPPRDIFRQSLEQVQTLLPIAPAPVPAASSSSAVGWIDSYRAADTRSCNDTGSGSGAEGGPRRILFPAGRQKRFIDSETERVSNIMMGMFQRGGSVSTAGLHL